MMPIAFQRDLDAPVAVARYCAASSRIVATAGVSRAARVDQTRLREARSSHQQSVFLGLFRDGRLVRFAQIQDYVLRQTLLLPAFVVMRRAHCGLDNCALIHAFQIKELLNPR